MKKLIVFAVVTVFVSGCSISPKPLEQKDIVKTITLDKERLYEGQEAVSGPMSLGEVMARALRYNLEFRTERMKSAVLRNQFELSKYDMLPSVAAEAGFISRNNQNASRSVSIFTGNETLEPSTSQDKDRKTANIGFSWNILDFGVSYYDAKQSADRYLISDRARRKVMSSILLQAHNAYWNALAAQDLQPQVNEALVNAREAVINIDSGLKAGVYRNPLDALKLKRQIIESIHQLESLDDTLVRSVISLKNLINLPPSTDLKLIKVNSEKQFSFADISRENLEMTALTNSADVLEQMYNARIDRAEIKKAFLRLLPGIEFNIDANYDDNSFYYNNDWVETSLQVSFNLMKLASAKQVMKNAKYRKALTEQRRLAVSMAVITQLNLAMQQWREADKQLKQAQSLKAIDDRISAITTTQSNQQKSLVERVQAQVAALQTNMAFTNSQVSLEGAEGTLFFTLGLLPLPENHETLSLDELAKSINSGLTRWYKGELAIIEVEK